MGDVGILSPLFSQSPSPEEKRLQYSSFLLIRATGCIKCLYNEYEYMTTTPIMMVTPRVYYWWLKQGIRFSSLASTWRRLSSGHRHMFQKSLDKVMKCFKHLDIAYAA